MGSKPASGAVCLGNRNVQKDCLLEGDGKSLDIDPKGSPFALVHLGHIQGKHQRSQGILEPWEGDFHSMRCPANVTPEKWGVVGQGLGLRLSTAEAEGMTGCSHAAVPGQELLQPRQQLGATSQ